MYPIKYKITMDDLPKHTFGAEWYRGKFPCAKCKDFYQCPVSGSISDSEKIRTNCFSNK